MHFGIPASPEAFSWRRNFSCSYTEQRRVECPAVSLEARQSICTKWLKEFFRYQKKYNAGRTYENTEKQNRGD